jgi:hypothetical protein
MMTNVLRLFYAEAEQQTGRDYAVIGADLLFF